MTLIIPCSHIPLLSLLALIFARRKTSDIFVKLKQAFIKILNTDKDGIWSGPLPGNFPAEWPLDTCDFYGHNPEAHCTFPWDFVVVFQEPQLSESQDVTWSLGRWSLQVNFRSNTHQAPPPTNKPPPLRLFVFILRITEFNQDHPHGLGCGTIPPRMGGSPVATPLRTRTLLHQSSVSTVAINFLGRDYVPWDKPLWLSVGKSSLAKALDDNHGFCELMNPLAMSWEKTISCPFSPLSYSSVLSPFPMVVLEP